MSNLSPIIDLFLRRAGLSASQKTTLCDDLGAVSRAITERRILEEDGYCGVLPSDAGKILVFEHFTDAFSVELLFSNASAFPAEQVVTLKNLTDHTATMNIHEDVILQGGTPEIPAGGGAQIYKRAGGDFIWQE